jgi:alkanesulfonate monooxygenase SsuD/methylene tetrahydromethanopterin reductase-like flavin-dependent oxidoreductase (luciferase family)
MERRLELGFLSFMPDKGDGSHGLLDGLRLIEHAEQLGYDTAWVRVRRFEPMLSSPMPFFAAAAERTTRIHFGTAVVPMRYEDPIRLAEDASTVDILSGGRLELGVGNGIRASAAVLDAVIGASERTFAEEAHARTTVLLRALRGEVLAVAPHGYLTRPEGAELTISPASQGLAERIWYGTGSVDGVARAAELGLHIHVSTLNNEETGRSFESQQALQVRAYREAYSSAHPERTPRITAARIILPELTSQDVEDHAEFVAGYASGLYPDGRPRNGAARRYSRVHHGHPDNIIEALIADEALAEATQLCVALPVNGTAASHRRALQLVAEHVAPALGWSPAK